MGHWFGRRDYAVEMPIPHFRIPAESNVPSRATTPVAPRRIYMGDILGYVTLVPASVPAAAAEPSFVEADQLYDRTSLHLYWNAKAHFERCRTALLEHAYRSGVRDTYRHHANLQALGFESDDVTAAARQDVEAGCRKIWALYHGHGSLASRESVGLLVESLADASYVGLESPTVDAMLQELSRLLAAGIIQRGR